MSGAVTERRMDFQADWDTPLLVVRAYMECSDVDWDPPARWDNGIPGIILDTTLIISSATIKKAAAAKSKTSAATGR